MTDHKKKKAEKNKAVWKSLSAHVARGEKAIEILEDLWLDHGPYRQDPISDATWMEVVRFMNFDDSE